jgi:hypothetical protein
VTVVTSREGLRQAYSSSTPARADGRSTALQLNVEDGPMDSVVHFEMPYENRERMAKFYKSAIPRS